jgi:hypothetical protein
VGDGSGFGLPGAAAEVKYCLIVREGREVIILIKR